MSKFFIILILVCGLNQTRAQTFSVPVNQSIPDDNTTVSFDILVSGLPSVIDTVFGLKLVCLSMNHTYCSDMDVKLKAPDGTTTILFSGVGGGGANFINTCLAGTGTAIASGSPPFTGSFQGMGVLGNANNGQNPNGIWQLLCTDMAAVDIGFLLDWSITFGSNPAIPFIFFSSTIPIVKLTTLAGSINDATKVPVLMQIVDHGPGFINYAADTIYSYEGKIMTEWQGFSGPSYPKKNYDFDLIDSLGVKIDTTLLGMLPENDWIFKAEYLDHSLLKNSIAYEFARRMGNYAPNTRPCEIILDGSYLGYYTLTEKIKRGINRLNVAKLTAADTTGIELTGGYIIEMNINGEAGTWNSVFPPINNATCALPVEFKDVYPKQADILPVQQNYIHSYVDSFETVLNSPGFENPVSGYRNFIDVNSFIDFLIVNEFSANYDSYGRSTYLYKEKSTDGGKLKIGPPWDYDRAMPYPGNTTGWVWLITHPGWPFPFWWSKMWSDSTYRKQLACRWTTLRQETLSTDSFLVYIDTLASQINQAAVRNFTVWNDLGGGTYNDQVNSLKTFMTDRLLWIDNTLSAENVVNPALYIPSDTLVCMGSLYDPSFNGLQYKYNWQPGPDSALIMLSDTGIYYLKVSDVNGCYSIGQMDVEFSQPDASFTSAPSGSQVTWGFTPNNPNGVLHNWNFGDGQVSPSSNPLHTFTSNGVYLVSLTLTDSIGCSEMSTETLSINSVSIQKLIADEIQVSPNPFGDQIRVFLPVNKKTVITLSNVLGQKMVEEQIIVEKQHFSFSTAQLPSGVYFLKITSAFSSTTRKMIKE